MGTFVLMVMLLLPACGSSGGPTLVPSSPKPPATAPAISSVSPTTGATTGGTVTTVKGSSFQGGAAVTFGGVPATSVTLASSTQLAATSPKGNVGTVDVVVMNPDGQTGTLSRGFTYTDPGSGGGSGGGLSGSPGATATQYVLTYTASTNKMCTIEVSQNQSFTPPVHAVDPSIFPGSDTDGQMNVGQRTFVVGERTIAAETDTAPSIAVPSGAAVRAPLKYDGYTTGAVTVTYSGQPFVAGDNIIVSGMSDSSFDSTWARVMSASANSFTYWTPATAAGTSGGGTITRSDHYSLALENNTTYYYRIGGPNNICGATPATGTFTTMDWPNGDTFAESFPTGSKGYFITPTIFETHDVSKNAVIDPYTGTLMRPMTLWSDDNSDTWGAIEGGQHHCTMQVDSNGFYHCYMLTGLYAINPGTGESRYLGGLYKTNSLCPNGTNITVNLNSVWDPTDPNKLYGICQNGSSSYIYSLTYTGGDSAVSPGTTASLSGPTQVGSGTVQSMLQTFDPSFNPAQFTYGGAIQAIEGGIASIGILRGSQGEPGWAVRFDLSTDQIIAATTSWNNGESAKCSGTSCTDFPPMRWAGIHGVAGIGDTTGTWGSFGTSDMSESSTGNAQVILNQTGGLNATDVTDTITITSSIVGPYGTTGDPATVNPFPDGSNFLDEARPGDIFQFADGTGEYVMVTARNSATSLTIARGCKPPVTYADPVCNQTKESAHAEGAVLKAICWSCINNGSSVEWDFRADPHGKDTTGNYFFANYTGSLGGHGGAELPWIIVEAWGIKYSTTWDANFFKGPLKYYVSSAPSFAGNDSLCTSGGCYSYPHYSPASPSTVDWAWDTNFYYGGISSDTSALVPGTSYIYKYTFGKAGSTPHVLYPNLPYWSVESAHWMTNISAPGAMLQDSTADNWKFCVAYQAGECWPGSSAGDIYGNLNIASPNPPTANCVAGFAYPSVTKGGWCVDNALAAANGLLQIGLTPANQIGTNSNNGLPIYGFGNSRKLLQGLFGPPGHISAHPQDLPDQSYAYIDAGIANPYVMSVPSYPTGPYDPQVYLVKIPPQPPNDGIDRTTYENVPIAVGAGSSGATHARVKYGYEENGPKNNFYCTQYKKTCYYSDQNLPLNGTVNLQVGIPQRVIFYQVEYLDNSNNVVVSGPITACAIP